MGAHVFDALRWYTGSEARVLFATLTDFNRQRGFLKTGMVQVTMVNGVMAQFWMSMEMPQPGLGSQAQWILVGSKGIIDCDNYGKVRLGRGDSWELVYEMPSFGLASDTISPVRLKAFAAQVQDFIEAIRDGRRPAVAGADGRAAVEMVIAARRSSDTNQAVSLPLAG
jgi:predicted dehydrogenase